MLRIFREYRLALFSGLLIGTSYIPFPPWALFFCLVPLWIFWSKEKSLKKIFLAGWLTQFVLNAIGFHWIAHTVVEFGRLPWIAGFGVLLLFCSLAHLYYPVAGIVWKILCRKFGLSETAGLLALPLVFILCERLYPFLFYWHLGYPWLWARFPAYQVAEYIGFFGLNLITLTINASLVLFWLKRKKGQWLHPYSVTPVLFFILLNLLGFFIHSKLATPDQTLKVVAIQGNIGNLDKIQQRSGVHAVRKVVDTFLRLSNEALEKHPDTEVLIWPETAFPETIYDNHLGPQRRRLAQLSRKHNLEIFTGAYQRNSKGRLFNSAVLLDEENLVDSYKKTMLLAFGEYFPFAEHYPKLKEMFPMVSDFGRGSGPMIIEARKMKIGPMICYEGLFDYFASELQQKGAQIFFNLTNDSWFGYPFEPNQHMFMTLARTIENRRPMVRVTNTGITRAILSDGTLLNQSPRDKEWYQYYEIPFHSSPPTTFYVNLSERWPFVLIFIIGLIIIGDRLARTSKY